MKFLTLTFVASLLYSESEAGQVSAGKEVRSKLRAPLPPFVDRRICGVPDDKCKSVKGKCLGKEACYKLYGDKMKWVPEGCKPNDEQRECGCCFRGGLRPTAQDIQYETIGLGVVLKSNDPEIVNFSFEVDKSTIRSLSLAHKKWNFNSYAGRQTKIVCDEKLCQAEVLGHAHNDWVDEVLPPQRVLDVVHEEEKNQTEHSNDAVFASTLIPASLKLTFPKPEGEEDSPKPGEIIKKTGVFREVTLLLHPKENEDLLKEKELILNEQGEWKFEVSWALSPIISSPWIDIPPIRLLERKKNICIQPVRTKYTYCRGITLFGRCFGTTVTTYSGDGLAFGRPGADEHWGKVDVTFTWRNWVTINDSTGKYQSLREDEMSSLRSEYSADDCIEIFFVKKFEPSETYGGGACWSSGTASAKIISSDEQVACGVDKTHIAHEIGHALGLMHPGSGGIEGSTGTLMCPSGWQRDNPRRQSRDNGSNIVNPLLVNTWGIYTFSLPECTNNGDCGTCNAHFPPDSC